MTTRAHRYEKRGGGVRPLPLDEAAQLSGKRAAELVALDDALVALEQLDKRKARVVELRYFGGLSVEEVAEVLQVSADTVGREWRRAPSCCARWKESDE